MTFPMEIHLQPALIKQQAEFAENIFKLSNELETEIHFASLVRWMSPQIPEIDGKSTDNWIQAFQKIKQL